MRSSLLLLTLLFFSLSASSTNHVVNTAGLTFSPVNITINVGDTVTWNNTGGSHNVNGTVATFPSNPTSFGNSVSGAPWTFTHVFTVPGLYNYQCDPHAGLGMVGTVQVNAVVYPPAVLNPGDLVFAGFQSDAPDGFSMIPMVDLPGNVEIKFTDRSWGPSTSNGGVFDWYSSTAEDTMSWVTPAAGVTKGTYIRFENPSTGGNMLIFGTGGSTTGSLSGISSSGDNIFCFTGSLNNPSFVAGLMTPRSNNVNLTWLTSGNAASTESYLPPSLVNGFSAFNFASAHVDNGYYNCVLSSADSATLRTTIYNQANWTTDNDPAIAGAANWPSCNLTFTTGPISSIVSFISMDQSVLEDVGTLQLHLSITPPPTSNETITVRLTPGLGLDPSDGSTLPAYDLMTGDIILPIASGQDSAVIDLVITDDALIETNETATFNIQALSSGLSAGLNTAVQITIVDNDFVSVGCADLFFSEYIEGSSNNKGLEIYNPTSATIDLTPYLIIESGNGGSFTDTLDLPGTLAPGATYVLCTNQSDAAMLAVADTALSFPSVSHFNGDDALILWNGTDTIDIIGEVGVDPGSSWPVGSGSTANNTLVRKIGVQSGSTNWLLGATQWDVYPSNTFGFFGTHTMSPCGSTSPTLSFSNALLTVNETGGSIALDVSIGNPDPNSATSVEIAVTGGSANNPADYTFTSPTAVTFAAGSTTPQQVTVVIVDDVVSDGDKTVDFVLQNATNNGNIVGGTLTLTIIDNDIIIPSYTIGQVTTNDASVQADSLGVLCQLEGVVYGENLRSSGLQFTLNDGSDGIHVFSGSPVSNYTVTEGDELRVFGTIDFFNGLTQIAADSITVLSQGNTLSNPTVVTALDETTESELVEIKDLTIVDPSQWTGSGSGFNVDVTDGTNTYQMRVDNDVDLYAQPVPSGAFHLRGIGGQFDSSSPYDSGYQILPRYSADIIPSIGIEELTESLRIYPNPVQDAFTVEIGALEDMQIQVTAMDGRIIMTREVANGDRISTSGWAAGIYMVTLQNDQVKTALRLVKN